MKSIAAALLAFALPCAAAQSIMAGDTVILAGDPAYPAGLAARGVQGRVLVRVTVDAMGKAAAVAVSESSRSPELDRAALALVRSWTHPPGEALVGIRFSKDSPATVPDKTCADFNIDKAWFLNAFPERKATDMEVVRIARDNVMFTLPGPQQMPYALAKDAVVAASIAACASQPHEKLFVLMQREAAKLPRK
jgi:TonB family protein